MAGFGLRLHELGAAPFWKAETYNTWAAKNFLQGKGFSDPVGATSPYLRAWATSSLPIAFSFAALGYTEFAARLPSVIFGLGTGIVLYLLARDTIGRKAGLISLGFLMFDFIAFTWHTQARMYAQSQFFYLAAVLVLFRWHKYDDLSLRSRYLVYMILVTLLGFHNHISFIGIGPSFLAFLILYLGYKLRKGEVNFSLSDQIFRTYLFWIVAVSVSAALFLYFNGIPSWLVGYSPAWYSSTRGSMYYLNWLLNHSSLYFLIGIGIFVCWEERDLWLPSISLVLPFIVQSAFIEFKEPRMIFHLYPLVILLAVKPLSDLTCRISDLFDSPVQDVLAILMILFFIAVFQSPLRMAGQVSDDPEGVINPKPNHRAAVGYIQERRNETDLIISTTPFITSWYLNGTEEIDYDLNSLNYGNNSRDPYSYRLGIQGVSGPAEMRNILENRTGWIITDENFRKKTPDPVRRVILSRAERIETVDIGGTEIYRFK